MTQTFANLYQNEFAVAAIGHPTLPLPWTLVEIELSCTVIEVRYKLTRNARK